MPDQSARSARARIHRRRTPRSETPAERLDRNLNELMGELRVVLPGVQVLFAFLLTVPFATGFESISDFERVLYLCVLLATAVACALLMAPTASHRMHFRAGRKREIIAAANRMMLSGLFFLALAMSGAILLVTHVLFGPAVAVPVTASAVVLFAGLWFALPLVLPDR